MSMRNIRVASFGIMVFLASSQTAIWGQEIDIQYNMPETKEGVTITQAAPSGCYFKVKLEQGKKGWIQAVGYKRDGSVTEWRPYEYEGEGAAHGWQVSSSNIARYEVNLWQNKWALGEGPEPDNTEAKERGRNYYFTDLIDGAWQDVSR